MSAVSLPLPICELNDVGQRGFEGSGADRCFRKGETVSHRAAKTQGKMVWGRKFLGRHSWSAFKVAAFHAVDGSVVRSVRFPHFLHRAPCVAPQGARFARPTRPRNGGEVDSFRGRRDAWQLGQRRLNLRQCKQSLSSRGSADTTRRTSRCHHRLSWRGGSQHPAVAHQCQRRFQGRLPVECPSCF